VLGVFGGVGVYSGKSYFIMVILPSWLTIYLQFK